MKYPINSFTQALKKSQKQIVLWVSLRNNFAAGAVSTSGYDWLLVDMEHNPNDLSTVLTQLDAIATAGSTAIVRPPWNDTVQVKRLLDIGAPGLLFPMEFEV
jgi:4-hydroxy-2-oxoheptanedioate aldolase